ncbi:MAG: TlpA disulfide reductase family protein [Gammaproteobacteria bacterium]
MKKLILIILFTLQLAYGFNQNAMSARDTAGNLIDFTELRGQWVIINYWASWCPPCIEEIPELNRFYQTYKNDNVTLLGVNYDRVNSEQLQQIIEDMDVQFLTLSADPAEELGIGEVLTLPATYILNPEGQLISKLIGPQTQASLLAAIGSTSDPTTELSQNTMREQYE